MANLNTHTCDVCNIQRQPSNHWFAIFRTLGGILVLEWETSASNEGYDVDNATAHLCGHPHVTEWMSKNFFNGKTGGADPIKHL